MTTVKITKKNVKMVAHRGLSGLERENTYPAFVAAGNRSYYGIETDIHVSPDGNFVVIHDETTKRVSGGAYNVNVEEVPYDVIKDIVLPDYDGSTHRQDIRIPLLRDYIHICKKYEKKCVLELKNRFETKDIVRLVDELKSMDYLENIIFISFCYDNCVDLRAILPEAKVQFLTDKPMSEEILAMLTAHNLDLDIHYPKIDKVWVDRLHALGIEVNVWTCNEKEHGNALAEMGVDYITTNILE